MINWFELLENLGIFAIIAGLIAWLVKYMIKIYLDKDFEKYKHLLREERIRFSKLHEKRARVISDLYSKLTGLEMDMISLTSPAEFVGEPSKEEKMKKTAKSMNHFLKYSSKHRIYFNEKICKILDDIERKLKHIFIEFDSRKHYSDVSPESSSKKDELWIKSWKGVTLEIPKVKNLLEKEFREILGCKLTQSSISK